MSDIRIHVLYTGKVCVAKELPFGGDSCNVIKASGIFSPKKNRLWLPVSSYYIEYKNKKILFDCGWHRNMSPKGVYDKKAQIASLGSHVLYCMNQGVIEKGQAINEQLELLHVQPKDLDVVLLSHLDCDHANGLELVKDAKQILVSKEELDFTQNKSVVNRIRYQSSWWTSTNISTFEWNDQEGPFHESYDVFGDKALQMIHIPGHSKGLCALTIRNDEGKYVLLFSDGGYATKSWKEGITSGIADNKEEQKKSLFWIKKESESIHCVESLANHDPEIKPHIIEL